MSDIAKKTLPQQAQGSWPASGNKSVSGVSAGGGNKTVTTAHNDDQASELVAPRSVVDDPAAASSVQNPDDNDNSNEAYDDNDDEYAAARSQYTHERTAADNNNQQQQQKGPLSEIPEEGGGGSVHTHSQKIANDASAMHSERGGIHLADNDANNGSALREVEPEAMSNKDYNYNTNHAASHHLQQEDEEHLDVEGEGEGDEKNFTPQADEDEEAAGSDQLTEQAKQAFDAASRGQPSAAGDARSSFLRTAARSVTAPLSGILGGGRSTKTGGNKAVTLDEGTPEEIPPQQEGDWDEGDSRAFVGGGDDAPTEGMREGASHVPTELQRGGTEMMGENDEQRTFGSQHPPPATEGMREGDATHVPTELQRGGTEMMEGEEFGSQHPPPATEGMREGDATHVPTELQRGGTEMMGGDQPEGTARFPATEGLQEGGGRLPTELRTRGAPTEGLHEGQQQVEDGEAAEEFQTAAEGVEGQQEQVPADEQQLAEGGEQLPAEEGEEVEPLDYSILKGGKVNKGGNVVNDDGKVVGRVTEGVLAQLIGKRVDETGQIWSDAGRVIGRAEPVTQGERDAMMAEPAPFEAFPDAVVNAEGYVVTAGTGEVVGKVVSGDLKVLRGKAVDADGDILDRGGNVVGRAERWEPEPEPVPEPEPEADRSALAGKRVNKAGNVVDGAGVIYGRVVEGDVGRMVGRMCDKNGNVLSESGDVIGRAEVVTEGEREGLREGPFAELRGCVVNKDGKVVTAAGEVVGRLVTGDPRVLAGRAVDEDGDVLDRNGNVIGHAERWEEEVVEKKKNPLSGRRVNREGNVVGEDGNLVGKLTTGDLSICTGKEIDDDGDVVDQKGTVIGHVSLLEEIPPPEEVGETEEEKAVREKAELDKKLAIQMAVCIEQCLDKIRPICKMITEKIEAAERQPEEERDEEALVREVRPLIEEGGRVLTEAKGIIKGLDPDGAISANAKHKTAAREATPEEYKLADVLKELTGEVTTTIENAKKKLEGMPRAKKELNPLWGLLHEPLFQILAAVGLLLSGVLNLVGRLLNGLGLGGIVDGLLGTLGLNRLLDGLGLSALTSGLTGGKKKQGGGGGGLLGGLLGGGK